MERQRLQQLLDDHGEDMASISRDVAQKNHSYLYQYFKKGTPRRLPEDVREAIEDHFEKPRGFLKGKTQNHHNDDFTQPETRPLIASDRVPVYGYVAGSTDRVAINDGKIIGMRERGPALAYAKEGFYVTVIGDSMEPRLRAGEYVAVNPSLPPIKGDECVVQYIDGEAIVKTFISQDAFNLKVSQYNPKKVLEISVKEIVSVYPVVAIEKGR